ncbi:MAG TPA: AmmeMemoRadiSam system protein A [Candidatus Binatia bacterium]|jgi:AmmeMemoRadiSam system protein A
MERIEIPPSSQKRLIALSRQTLESFVRGAADAAETIDDPCLLHSRYGAFVSLHRQNELRGCVGTCFPTSPLYETVIDMTEAAAARDRRVAAVTSRELAEIRIDISVLSALEPVTDPLSLQIGKHGLYVESGGKHGVLLPQVATQYGWDLETFLSQTCVKAYLPKDEWRRPNTKISSFIALIIEEKR